jgi:hypothetical protein
MSSNTSNDVIVKIFNLDDIHKMEDEVVIMLNARISIKNCPNIINTYIEDGKGYLFIENIKGETLHSLSLKNPDIISEKKVQIREILIKLLNYDISFKEINWNMFTIKDNKLFLTDFNNAYRIKF